MSIAVSADPPVLCSGSSDKSVHIWNVDEGRVARTHWLPEGVFDVSWCSDGQRLSVCGDNGTVFILLLSFE